MISFQEKFKQECIDGSAIAPSLFESAIQMIEDRGNWEPNRALNQNISTQWQTIQPHSYGAIAAFMQATGEIWTSKPQCPKQDEDGKLRK